MTFLPKIGHQKGNKRGKRKWTILNLLKSDVWICSTQWIQVISWQGTWSLSVARKTIHWLWFISTVYPITPLIEFCFNNKVIASSAKLILRRSYYTNFDCRECSTVWMRYSALNKCSHWLLYTPYNELFFSNLWNDSIIAVTISEDPNWSLKQVIKRKHALTPTTAAKLPIWNSLWQVDSCRQHMIFPLLQPTFVPYNSAIAWKHEKSTLPSPNVISR